MTTATSSASRARWIEQYDAEIAKGFLAANQKLSGLPEFLGVQLTEFSLGRLRAEMPANPDLLTPFGNMHGGVLSALVDHVLGCVCHPHMKRGQWAWTTELKINLLAPPQQWNRGCRGGDPLPRGRQLWCASVSRTRAAPSVWPRGPC